jgi:hypothetical protein
VVTGTVYDSVTTTPLAGAIVQLAAQDDPKRVLTASADSLGRYRIEGVRPGRYLAGFLHPTLDVLGLDASTRLVEIPADTVGRLDLAIPAGARLRTAICGAGTRMTDSTGVVVGQVRDAETNAPVDDARVVVTWQELSLGAGGVHLERRRIPAVVRPGGYYAVCGVPADDPIVGGAEAPGRRAGLVELRVPAGRVVRRDFLLADSAAAVAEASDDSAAGGTERLRGPAALRGVVRRPDGKPAPGARVLVLGTDRRTTAGDDGRFALDGLPSGTYSVEARALGFEPQRVAVDLTSRRPGEAEIGLRGRITTLETVQVLGRTSPAMQARLTFFERQKRSGGGAFLSADDLAKTHPVDVTDALRRLPSVEIVLRRPGPADATSGPKRLYLHGGASHRLCRPDVYIDGAIVYDGASDLDALVRPDEVVGVELYRNGSGAPAEFATTRARDCGVLLVWTNR